jgi:hypothetical protein
MLKNKLQKLLCILIHVSGFIAPLQAEGTKQLSPTATDMVHLYLCNTSNNSFGRYDGVDNQRLYIHISNPSTEQIFLGFAQARSAIAYPCSGNVLTAYFRIKNASGTVIYPTVGSATGQALPANIAGWANAVAGPNQIVGAGGYNAVQVDPAAFGAGDYYVEFSTNASAYSSTLIAMPWWDITVATKGGSPTAINGRVFAKNWAMATPPINCTGTSGCASADQFGTFDRAFNGTFHVYSTADSLVTKVNFDSSGLRPYAFNIFFNNTGTGTTGNILTDRKSVLGLASAAALYPIFLSNPDSIAYPSGHIGGFTAEPFLVSCNSLTGTFYVEVDKAGQIDILVDLSQPGAPYLFDAGTRDVALAIKVVPQMGEVPPYRRTVFWNGKDGLGAQVNLSVPLTYTVNYSQGIFHFPIYDAEFFTKGFKFETVRPLPPLGAVAIKNYYDDSNITFSNLNGNPKVELNGCAAPCHKWNNMCYGDVTTVNTWFFGSEEKRFKYEASVCWVDAWRDSAVVSTTSSTIPVLANDGGTRIDPSSLTTSGVAQPLHGTVSVDPVTHYILYTPTIGYVGRDSFQYRICDTGTYSCDTAWVWLNVIYCAPFSAPTVNIVQPPCVGVGGTITVTSPTLGMMYSFNNGVSFQAGATSAPLSPNTYQVRVRDNSNTCVSDPQTAVLMAPPPIPAPTVSEVQPTCQINTGTITVTSPASGVTYSFNNGVTFQVSATSNPLTVNTYQVVVKDNNNSCISAAAPVTLAAPPLCCDNTTGIITFQIAGQNTDSTYFQQYALTDTNGIILQMSTIKRFEGLTSGRYKVYALNFEATSTVNGFTLGRNIAGVTGSCVQVSAPLSYLVCLMEIMNNGLDDDFDGRIDGEDSDLPPMTCNNTSGNITFSAAWQNTSWDYTQQYILTDTFDIIRQISTQPFFNQVASGDYRVFALNYYTATGVSGLTVGAAWRLVTGSCYQKSPALLFKVCITPEICNNGIDDDNDGLIDEEDIDCGTQACNNTTGNIAFSIAGLRADSVFKVKYLLINSLGTIQKIDTLTQFSNVATGRYRIYGVSYDTTNPVTGGNVGQQMAYVSNFYQKSLPLLYKVCIATEICGDGIDNDGDGLIDGEDADCPPLACTDMSSSISATFNLPSLPYYTQRYALTDSTGRILQVASFAQFNNLGSGSYRIYSVLYDAMMGIQHLTPNDTITKVTGRDFSVSVPQLRRVCLTAPTEICNNLLDDDNDGYIDCEDTDCVACVCNNADGTLTFNVSLNNPSANHTRRYLLTNLLGVLIQTSNQPIFTDCANGSYRVYTFFYDASQFTPTFALGSTVAAQAGAGTSVELNQLFKVCRPESNYEVQVVVQNYDCATQKATIQLQVRTKAGTSPFMMGDAHFRLNYDTLEMHQPILRNQNLFSNAAMALDSNYQNQTLTGSSEAARNADLVVNVAYSGALNSGKWVSSTWLTVSTLEMTAQNAATQLNLTWRTAVMQPQTEVNQINLREQAGDYESKTVAASGVFNALNYDIQNFCNCISLDLKVLLEGPFRATTGTMHTVLNQRGLLPGQIPLGLFGQPTPSGQPYAAAPWYYYGKESVSTYAPTVVDWVLVTVRSDSASADSVVLRQAGLLHQDGRIEFIHNCWYLPSGKRYFVVVEHRNHLGVMSPNGQVLSNGSVFRHDFTLADSYIWNNPLSAGQKWVGGKWLLLSADGRKNTFYNNFDLDLLDRLYWKEQTGVFDAYRDSDYNLDADVNLYDALLWKRNNGQTSKVPHR